MTMSGKTLFSHLHRWRSSQAQKKRDADMAEEILRARTKDRKEYEDKRKLKLSHGIM